MINTKNLDFEQRFSLMSGTTTYATMDTLEEVIQYRSTLDDLTRHFCKIGDRLKHSIIDGFDFGWSQYYGDIEGSPRWRPW